MGKVAPRSLPHSGALHLRGSMDVVTKAVVDTRSSMQVRASLLPADTPPVTTRATAASARSALHRTTMVSYAFASPPRSSIAMRRKNSARSCANPGREAFETTSRASVLRTRVMGRRRRRSVGRRRRSFRPSTRRISRARSRGSRHATITRRSDPSSYARILDEHVNVGWASRGDRRGHHGGHARELRLEDAAIVESAESIGRRCTGAICRTFPRSARPRGARARETTGSLVAQLVPIDAGRCSPRTVRSSRRPSSASSRAEELLALSSSAIGDGARQVDASPIGDDRRARGIPRAEGSTLARAPRSRGRRARQRLRASQASTDDDERRRHVDVHWPCGSMSVRDRLVDHAATAVDAGHLAFAAQPASACAPLPPPSRARPRRSERTFAKIVQPPDEEQDHREIAKRFPLRHHYILEHHDLDPDHGRRGG